MTVDTVIATRALTKRYREVTAVYSLELDVRRGEIYGFLGRNGAGKTTTIRMLLGLSRGGRSLSSSTSKGVRMRSPSMRSRR